jgi:hypothetical protein
LFQKLNADSIRGVLAVVDADFGLITGSLETDPNLVYCDGHDCMELLSFALNGTIGTKKSETDDRKSTKVTRESLEREFRLAFSEVDFSRTELFPAICDWEAANTDAYKILGHNTRAVQIAVSIANRSMITPPHPPK